MEDFIKEWQESTPNERIAMAIFYICMAPFALVCLAFVITLGLPFIIIGVLLFGTAFFSQWW